MVLVFKPLTEADLPTLTEWLNRPHVAKWWNASTSLEEVRMQYLPCLRVGSAVRPYLVYLDDVPIGYIQSYVAADAGDGWWPNQHDPGVRGIDQFLADGQCLGQGLGTQMVTEFVQRLFEDPNVTKIQADPHPSNERAIRCYQKSGFRRVGAVDTPDGTAILMVIERISD